MGGSQGEVTVTEMDGDYVPLQVTLHCKPEATTELKSCHAKILKQICK